MVIDQQFNSTELPDLIPDEKEIEKSARLEDVPIYRLQCALEENCLSSNAYNYHQNDLGNKLLITRWIN